MTPKSNRLDKIWQNYDIKSPTPIGLLHVITMSNLVQSRWIWRHSTELDELLRMSYHLCKFFSFQKIALWLFNFQGSVSRTNQVGFCQFWCHSTHLDEFYNKRLTDHFLTHWGRKKEWGVRTEELPRSFSINSIQSYSLPSHSINEWVIIKKWQFIPLRIYQILTRTSICPNRSLVCFTILSKVFSSRTSPIVVTI